MTDVDSKPAGCFGYVLAYAVLLLVIGPAWLLLSIVIAALFIGEETMGQWSILAFVGFIGGPAFGLPFVLTLGGFIYDLVSDYRATANYRTPKQRADDERRKAKRPERFPQRLVRRLMMPWHLVRLRSSNKATRLTALTEIAKASPTRYCRAIDNLISEIASVLDEDSRESWELGQLVDEALKVGPPPTDELRPVLSRFVLQDHVPSFHKLTAIHLLGKIGNEAAVATLKRAFKADQDLRSSAAAALAAVGTSDALKFLKRALKSQNVDEFGRMHVARALIPHGVNPAFDIVAKGLSAQYGPGSDSYEDAKLLRKHGDARGCAYLLKYLSVSRKTGAVTRDDIETVVRELKDCWYTFRKDIDEAALQKAARQKTMQLGYMCDPNLTSDGISKFVFKETVDLYEIASLARDALRLRESDDSDDTYQLQ